MANSSNNMTSIVGILAIVVLVGIAVFFILDRNDSDLDIDIGLMLDVPVSQATV